MNNEYIKSPNQALVHLAFHCCLKDGELQTSELDSISGTFVSKGLNKELDIKEEMAHYQSYHKSIKDETTYLRFLLDTIKPKNKLALFAFCAEIIYRDGNVAISEELLLNRIAGILYIRESDNQTIQNLIAELNDVEKRNAF